MGINHASIHEITCQKIAGMTFIETNTSRTMPWGMKNVQEKVTIAHAISVVDNMWCLHAGRDIRFKDKLTVLWWRKWNLGDLCFQD
ncbi:MAG: hypothetical protein LWW98_02585 [Deltaproteobacteria bacterium]|nr:hypothetical protein [Deltaproteobacteria bacterium]